jgi:hypothetical protein
MRQPPPEPKLKGQFFDAVGAKPDVDSIRRDDDLLDQKPRNALLLGREQLFQIWSSRAMATVTCPGYYVLIFNNILFTQKCSRGSWR